MKRVVIVQRRMTHYRVQLFERLRENLRQRGVALDVLVGEGTESERQKYDAGLLPWAQPLQTRYFAGGRMCLQPMGKYLRGADLVVVTQENKLLYNHWLLLQLRRFKLAFWGHGANLQSDNLNGLRERYKRWTTNKVDWWFAYTDKSAELICKASFPQNRITVLNNTVDTSEFADQVASITDEESMRLRQLLTLGDGPVGVYVGSFYKEKRLEMFVEAARIIRHAIPGFVLLILGDGPERQRIESFCAEYDWVQWLGPCFGREKALYLSIAQVMLNPGAVGLGILDSFVSGVPIVTSDCWTHGPEISYLKSGVNGLITSNNLMTFAQACVDLLRDPIMLQNLRAGCLASAKQYSLEKMVINFSEGIEKALAQETKQ